MAGQRHVCAVLRSAARRPRPPQQILLAGPSGLGKTTTARIFAAALLCPHRTERGDACGICDSCLEVTGQAGGHPDVVELDAASNGGKDEIRELAARAQLVPLRSPWKIYIVDEAHGLTGPGGQAFLRLLEEPPPHCLFILATTDPEKLPVALRGRCIALEVLPPTDDEIRTNLKRIAAGEDWDLEDETIDAVLAASDPALGTRGTVMTIEKLAGHLDTGRPISPDTLEDVLGVATSERMHELTTAIVAGDHGRALSALFSLNEHGGRTHLRRQLTAWARNDLATAVAAGSPIDEKLYRYTVLVEAPQYEGALTIAVARAASPELSTSTEAVRALIERAQTTLDALASLSGTQATPPAGNAPDHSATPPPPPGPNEPVPDPTAADDPPHTSVPVTAPEVVALLNVVARTNGSAAFALRRCEFTTRDGALLVRVPAHQKAKAEACDLPSAIQRAAASGVLVTLVE